jgi:intraflagellar transport protein 52
MAQTNLLLLGGPRAPFTG